MRYLCFLFLLLMSQFALSVEQYHTAQVARVYPLASGDFVLTFKAQSSFCKNLDKYYYVSVGKNGVTQEGSEKMMSVALAAASMGKPLTVLFDDASSECSINRLLVDF